MRYLKDKTFFEFIYNGQTAKKTKMVCLDKDMLRADFYMDEYIPENSIFVVMTKLKLANRAIFSQD